MTPLFRSCSNNAMVVELTGHSSVNDFALYQVALGMGHTKDAEKYLDRSRNWRNHWNKKMTALNHTGFVGPRSKRGKLLRQDPLSCGGCYWNDDCKSALPFPSRNTSAHPGSLTQVADYQGLPWEYTFNAHHDLATLVTLSGGPEKFADRLETTFRPGMVNGNFEFDQTIFNPGNEPSFGTPYLYNFVGRQDLSVLRSRFVARSYYHPTPDGLPGNSDAGAMESWLLWNMIGLYPLTGQTTFLVGSPWFKDLTIQLGEGRKLEITATGGSDTSFYVQSLKVNGEEWDKSWITWQDVFADGGTLAFELGPEPKDWATGPPPPSPAIGASLGVGIPGAWNYLGVDTMAAALIGVVVLATGTVIFLMFKMHARNAPPAEDFRDREAGYERVEAGPGFEYVDSVYDLESVDGDGKGRWRQ